MADSYIQVAPDSSGKKVQTYENTVGGETVEAQAVVLVDSTGAPITLPSVASTTNLLAGDGSGNAVATKISQVSGNEYEFRSDQSTDDTLFRIFNNTDGADAGATLEIETSGGRLGLWSLSLTNTAFGIAQPDEIAIYSDQNAINIMQNDIGPNAGAIRFSVDWSNEHFGIHPIKVTSAAGATNDNICVPAATTIISGTTQITTAKGFNKFSIYKPTYTDSSAVTIDQGATLYIEDAPAAAGSVTLTNPYALWVDAGVSRFDGNIAANGGITMAENTSIALDPAGSADGKYSGITVAGTGGATIAFGDLVTLDKDDSRWELVDISVAAAATGDARGILGMAVTSSSDGAALTVLLHGIIRADANFPALTIGAPVYASTTGDVVVAQPTTTDYVIRIVGYGLTADEMYFNPDCGWITHT